MLLERLEGGARGFRFGDVGRGVERGVDMEAGIFAPTSLCATAEEVVNPTEVVVSSLLGSAIRVVRRGARRCYGAVLSLSELLVGELRLRDDGQGRRRNSDHSLGVALECRRARC